MKTIGLAAKLNDCCEAAGIELSDFITDYGGSTGPDSRTIESWTEAGESVRIDLRKPGRTLLAYWKDKGLPLVDADFNLSRRAFRKKLGLADLLEASDIPAHWRLLAGVYQVIRPNAESDQAYIFEGMEIRIDGGLVRAYYYSGDHTRPELLYSGTATPAERYFFTLVVRPHEVHPERRALRSLAFYVAEDFDRSCLTGLMIRGMSGTNSDKGLASLPFVAIALENEAPLRDNKNVPIKKPKPGANEMVVSKHGGHLVLGDAHKNAYPTLFAFGDAIFNEPAIRGSIMRGGLKLRTIAPSVLKDAVGVDREAWEKVVADLPLRDADSVA